MGRKEFYEKMDELKRIRLVLVNHHHRSGSNKQQFFQVENQIEHLKLLR